MGNKTGWILAGGVALGVLAIAFFVIFNPLPSPPRESNAAGFLDLKLVTVPLTDVIQSAPSGPGNAAEDYDKAIDLWEAHREAINATGKVAQYDALVESSDPWSDPALQACKQIAEHISAGAKKKKMEYTFLYSPKKLAFCFYHRHADQLGGIATPLSHIARIHQDRKEYAAADRCLKDLLILGVHLFNERALPDVGLEGLKIQRAAVQRLQELYSAWENAPARPMDSLQSYERSLKAIVLEYESKKKILWDNIPGFDLRTSRPKLSAGDVYNMAEYEQDRVWRVQAVIALGAVKHHATERGDIKKTGDLIQHFLASEDPLLAAAAKAANDLTPEQFRQSGNNFGAPEE